MRQQYLFVLLLLLAVVALAWSYNDYQAASVELAAAAAKHQAAIAVSDKIKILKTGTDDAVAVAEAKFDPSAFVVSVLRQLRIELPKGFSTSQSRLGKIEGTTIDECKINLSRLTCSLSQVDRLTRKLAEANFECAVKSITLSPATSKTGQELWNTELDIRFLRQRSQ